MSMSSLRYAEITGWGKCLPPARLTNDDLATVLDTSNDWIVKRTGIRQRPISHVPVSGLAHVACARALACAGLASEQVDLIIIGTCTGDEQMPNTASRVQRLLGARHAAAIDINTACTSFMYALSMASSLIRTGAIRKAVVVGADTLTRYMDWSNRGPAVLFGDGAGAVVLEEVRRPTGIVGEVLGCDTDDREMLRINGTNAALTNASRTQCAISWVFNGPEIFRQAVNRMVNASRRVLEKCGLALSDVDVAIPHQANLRIIESIARRLGIAEDRVFSNVASCGNLSSASIPVAIADAIEQGRIAGGDDLLIPAFGGGLTWSAHVVRWGERIQPLGSCDVSLPYSSATGLQLLTTLLAGGGTLRKHAPDTCPSVSPV